MTPEQLSSCVGEEVIQETESDHFHGILCGFDALGRPLVDFGDGPVAVTEAQKLTCLTLIRRGQSPRKSPEERLEVALSLLRDAAEELVATPQTRAYGLRLANIIREKLG